MKMKKLAALALSAVFALGALTACGGSSSSGSVPAAASGSGSVSGASLKEVNIGLIQLMEHASLDEIRTAIEAGLEAKGAEYGVKVNVDYQNAQGDTSIHFHPTLVGVRRHRVPYAARLQHRHAHG